MLKIYGSMLCPDCVQCRADLDKACVVYEYLDFADNLKNLKEFLAIRDYEPVFEEVKEQGSIGIPCIVDEQGKVLLDWSIYVGQAEA
ncbi:MAG: glutaredoxin [Ruminococcaceae bacterium]|nr:glutaredoxin [Oscillospiraceae bacterium]